MPRARGTSRSLRVVAALMLLATLAAAPDRGRAGAATAAPLAAHAAQRQAYDQSIAQAKAAMLGNPVQARAFGALAQSQAAAWPRSRAREIAIATAQWIEGEGALRANDIAGAGPLITAALATVERAAPEDSLRANLLLSRARLRRLTNLPQQALADLQLAYHMFVRAGDARSQAKALQSIGLIYHDAQDYHREIYYYELADEAYSADLGLRLSASNNIANAYLQLGRLSEAQVAYGHSLRLAKRLASPLLEAKILTNLADLAIERHDYAAAADAIAAGLKLTGRPTAASGRSLLLGEQAKLAFTRGQLSAAMRDLAAAFAGSDDTTTDQSFSALHLTAYHVYKAAGDDARALAHLETYRRMDDEGRSLAASTNAALMTARFDFANQNARIATLKTGQLRRDVALTKLRARQATVVFSGLVMLLLVVVLFLFVYVRSVRRNRAQVVETNEQLARTNLELGEALKAKSQFLATTSHEIRTPLNGILGMTQVILADTDVPGGVRDRVALVDSAGRSMRSLVDDILDFAKMDAGKVSVEAQATDLTVIVPEIVALWRAQAHDKGIDVRLGLTGVERPLLTDAARLRQIMFNLLSNAIKFTTRGEVAVDVRAADEGGRPVVHLTVSDTGIGIPPAAFAAIFEPFHQLDTSTTRQFGGTGLGLAISRHLARVLGGDITLTSRAGKGSAFVLTLPYAAGTAGPATAPARTASAAGGLLVASANPIRRSFLRTALEPEFGRVAACGTADLADWLTDSAAYAVVLDVADEATAAEVDQLVTRPAVRGAALVVLLPPALAAGVDEWRAAAVRVAVKPLRIDALAALIRAALAGAADPDATASRPMAFEADLP